MPTGYTFDEIQELRFENRRLATLLDEIKQENDTLRSHARDAEQAFQNYGEIKQENQQLREALKVYANKRNWTRNGPHLNIFTCDTNGPYIAIKVLEREKEKSKGGRKI